MKPADLTGRRFGRLVVVSFAGCRGAKRLWNCKCDCGKETMSAAGNLVSGRAASCGCVAIEKTVARSTTHGGCGSPEYRAWQNMLSRCERPGSSAYARYGKAGILVCPEWHSFEQFFQDLGPRPAPKHSVDRIDNTRGYKPANCRWATPSQQAGNRRRSIVVEHRGTVCSLKEACAAAGVVYGSARYRYKKSGILPDGMQRSEHPAVAILSYRDQEAKAQCREGAQEALLRLPPIPGEDPAFHEFQRELYADFAGTEYPYRLVCLNTASRGSWQFNSVYDPEKHDVMVAYCRLKTGKWRVSLYSTKPEVDCGAICKSFGGGGHAGAAGFLCDELPWEAK